MFHIILYGTSVWPIAPPLPWVSTSCLPLHSACLRSVSWPSYLYNENPIPGNTVFTLLRRHNGLDGISNLQPHECLLKRSFRRRSKKTSKLRATGLCAGNSPETGEFPAQMATNAENVSIWWRHNDIEMGPNWLASPWPAVLLILPRRK